MKDKPFGGNAYEAVLGCPHEIDSNRVVLHFDSKQPGHNALNQLSRRIASVQLGVDKQIGACDGVADSATEHEILADWDRSDEAIEAWFMQHADRLKKALNLKENYYEPSRRQHYTPTPLGGEMESTPWSTYVLYDDDLRPVLIGTVLREVNHYLLSIVDRSGATPVVFERTFSTSDIDQEAESAVPDDEAEQVTTFSDEDITEIESEIAADKQKNYCVKHHYDIGDQQVFVRRVRGDVDPVKAAVYMQLLCEEWFGKSKMLTNLGVASLLVTFYGFQHGAATPLCTEIDMYFEREKRFIADASLHREGLRDAMAPHVVG